MPSLQHQPAPQVVLAVAAHPDDIEYMAGGTLATWSDQGCKIHYLIVTDGSGGSRDPQQDQVALAAQRRREQMAAAAVLGVASVTFLGRCDAELEPSLDLRVAIARVIRQTRPDAVLTFDPHMLYRAATINHPDHVVVGTSTLGAVMPLANTCLAAPALRAEGLEPHDVRALYLFEPATPSHWMPLTAQVIARKVAALREHISQLALWDGEGCVYQRARATAQIAATRGVRCAFAEDYARMTNNVQQSARQRERGFGGFSPPRENLFLRCKSDRIVIVDFLDQLCYKSRIQGIPHIKRPVWEPIFFGASCRSFQPC